MNKYVQEYRQVAKQLCKSYQKNTTRAKYYHTTNT